MRDTDIMTSEQIIRDAVREAYAPAAEMQMLSAKSTYSPAEVSRLYGISVSTLEKMRADNRGPAYVALGPRKIIYTKKAIEQWMDVQTITPRSI